MYPDNVLFTKINGKLELEYKENDNFRDFLEFIHKQYLNNNDKVMKSTYEHIKYYIDTIDQTKGDDPYFKFNKIDVANIQQLLKLNLQYLITFDEDFKFDHFSSKERSRVYKNIKYRNCSFYLSMTKVKYNNQTILVFGGGRMPLVGGTGNMIASLAYELINMDDRLLYRILRINNTDKNVYTVAPEISNNPDTVSPWEYFIRDSNLPNNHITEIVFEGYAGRIYLMNLMI